MREYMVYRQAPGAADKTPVLRVQAASAEEACRMAAEQVPVAPGQTLTAEPADHLDAKEEALNLTAEAIERAPGGAS
jgi:hypothetical protein